MTTRKASADKPVLSEAEIGQRIDMASGASALAGHSISEEDREMARQVLRGDLAIEDAIESIRRDAHSAG
jgi:hypothetical protein